MADRKRPRRGTPEAIAEEQGGEVQKPLRAPEEDDELSVEEEILEEHAEQRAEREGRGQYGNGSRGRHAESPTEIPPRGWRDVAKRTLWRTSTDNVSLVAAGVAFYFFFALFPGLAALFTVYGLVADPAQIHEQVESFSHVIPKDVRDIVIAQLEAQAERPASKLGWTLALSLAMALYAIARGMLSLVLAMNIAYQESETRSFLRVYALGFLFSIGALVTAVVSVLAIGLVPVAFGLVELGPLERWIAALLSWGVLLAVFVLGLAVLYRYGPARKDAKWRWITPGAALAVITWLLSSVGFALYLANFGNYDEAYGTLGGVAVLLFWLWISAFLVVTGAELDAELEMQTARDTTVEPHHPMGQRGAYVADHVGPSPP